MNNLIIVESEADKYFIEALIKNLNINNIEVGLPICSIDDYDCLGGFNNLEKRLKEIRFDKYENIGIILDSDEEGIVKKVEFINKTFKNICPDLEIVDICTFYKSNQEEINVACYITNIDGYGELENILKEVKSKESIYADCLDSWRKCIESKGKVVTDKEFNKNWVNNYLRLDTCTNAKHKGNKAKYCSQSEESIKKDIWDFNNKYLDDLKKFLMLFK